MKYERYNAAYRNRKAAAVLRQAQHDRDDEERRNGKSGCSF